MKGPGWRIVILTVAIFLIGCLTLQAARVDKSDKPIDRTTLAKQKALAYALPYDRQGAHATGEGRLPVGVPYYESSLGASPGVTVGYTWHDLQQRASMGRMIETGPHSGETGSTIVHMGWMHMPGSVFDAPTYMYNAYKSVDHSFAGAYRLHDPDDQYSGYVNVDVTPDNRAIVGGHCNAKGPVEYQVQMHFDACPACELFDTYVRVPDSVAGYDQMDGVESLYPRFFFQFATDTVLHLLATITDYDDPGQSITIAYFRKVGYEGSADSEWDYPPYIVDTIQSYSYDITGLRTGDRVAMSWMASLPYQQPECDTCSGMSAYTGLLVASMDNDLYCQTSEDQGATWNPRMNLTQAQVGEAAYKAFADLSLLFDFGGNLHVVWTGCPWPADPCVLSPPPCFEEEFYREKARLFHWSENIPYVRSIVDRTFDPVEECGPPWWALRIAKPTLSECDNKLYVLWTEFNSITEGIYDDCAQWGYDQSQYWGAANGDLWVTASSDYGMTWGQGLNLTASYTPHCDPYTAEDCQSDYWGSMTRWGREIQAGEDWTPAVVVDPTGGSAVTDYYLDIQYVNDLDAGGVILGEGGWTNSPIKWFRMPCYEPGFWLDCPPWHDLWVIGPPTYTKPGEQLDVDISFENYGNTDLTYNLTFVEDNGPSGWLGASGFDGYVPAATKEEGTVHLNVGGIIVDEGMYYGHLVFEFDCFQGPESASIEIHLLVADTLVLPVWDTVNTNCLALTVANNGNMGHDGWGTVNMDYYPEDCDTTASVYMYDGSPFIGRIMDGDTVFNWAIFGVDYLDEFGLRPRGGQTDAMYCAELDAEVFESGTFTTSDQSIAFEKIWVAPQDACEFIIEYLRIWSYDGNPHTGLMLGEAIDWDVPWDFLVDDPQGNVHMSNNTGGIDFARNLLYQRGYEAYGLGSDTGYPYNCYYNDERFAGNAFVESYLNGSPRMPMPYGGFIGENDVLVYPAVNGFVPGLFYQDAVQSGLRGIDSTEDLHMAMTFEADLDLGETDVYEVVTVLATIQQGALSDLQAAVDLAGDWYSAHGGIEMFADNDETGQIDLCENCCQVMGDINGDGELNPLDAIAFVQCLWPPIPPPPAYCFECPERLDVNCSGGTDPLDAVYFINYFWKNGPAPCDCSEVP